MCIGSILKLKRNPPSNCEIARCNGRRRLTVAATWDPMAKPFKRRGLAIMRLTVALGVGAAVCVVALVPGARWVVWGTGGWGGPAAGARDHALDRRAGSRRGGLRRRTRHGSQLGCWRYGRLGGHGDSRSRADLGQCRRPQPRRNGEAGAG